MLDLLRRKDSPPPDTQFRRTYQNDLRAIGRHADDAGFRELGVYEVSEGFVMRAQTRADPNSVEAVEIPDSDLQSLILKNFTARGHSNGGNKRSLCPTGYEDFLRALGHELDANSAKGVAIQELVDMFAVAYHQLESTPEGYVWEAKSMLLDADKIRELLDSAFRRRGAGHHRKKAS